MNISPSPVIIIERKRSSSSRVAAFLLLLVANYVLFRVVCSAYMFTTVSPDDSVDIEVRYQRDLLSEAEGPSSSVENSQLQALETSAMADATMLPAADTATQAALVETVPSSRWSHGPLAWIRQHYIKSAALLVSLLAVLSLASVMVCMWQGLIPVPDFVADVLQFLRQVYEEVCRGALYVYECVASGDLLGLLRSFGNLVTDTLYQIKDWLYQAFNTVWAFFTGHPYDLEGFPTIVDDSAYYRTVDGVSVGDYEQCDFGPYNGSDVVSSPPLSLEPLDISDPSQFTPRNVIVGV